MERRDLGTVACAATAGVATAAVSRGLYHAIVRHLTRREFALLSEGRWREHLRAFAPHAMLRVSGLHALSGVAHGHDAIEATFAQLYDLLPTHRFEVHRVWVQGWPWDTRVAVHFTEQATPRDGEPFTGEGCNVIRLRFGRVVEELVHPDTQRQAEALAPR